MNYTNCHVNRKGINRAYDGNRWLWGRFGTLTTGGSNGNMLGMLCARQYADPMSSLNGFDGTKYVAFVSESTLLSFDVSKCYWHWSSKSNQSKV